MAAAEDECVVEAPAAVDAPASAVSPRLCWRRVSASLPALLRCSRHYYCLNAAAAASQLRDAAALIKCGARGDTLQKLKAERENIVIILKSQ